MGAQEDALLVQVSAGDFRSAHKLLLDARRADLATALAECCDEYGIALSQPGPSPAAAAAAAAAAHRDKGGAQIGARVRMCVDDGADADQSHLSAMYMAHAAHLDELGLFSGSMFYRQRAQGLAAGPAATQA